MRSLAAYRTGSVKVIAESDLGPERRRQGWVTPDYGDAELLIAPSLAERRALLKAHAGPDSMNIFSGFHLGKQNAETLRAASRLDARLGVFVEAGRLDDGLKALLRRARYIAAAARYARRLDFLLVAGTLGEDYYRGCGFPARRMFRFGYFTEPSCLPPAVGTRRAMSPRFIFVGALEPRKGVDVALAALGALRDFEWSLEVVGSGSAEASLRSAAEHLGLADRISWRGNLRNSAAVEAMAGADYLLLPSRFDGWGAVVNEALQVGTPVLASDAVGARDLIGGEGWRGAVFGSADPEALRQVLARCIGEGCTSPERRTRIRDWAEACISPPAGARYLSAILDAIAEESASFPVPPWMDGMTSLAASDHSLRAVRK